MRLKLLTSGIALAIPLLALAAPAHVHGVAHMDLAVDGNTLSLSLEMPLDSAVGFESLPKTDLQKAALAQATETLNKAAELFTPTAAAECMVDSVTVENPFPDAKAKQDGHADLDAEYVFHCARPLALKGLETKLFKHFTRLQRIEVQRATAGGQGAATMSAKRPRISW